MGRREVSEAALADALRKAGGNKSEAARMVKLTRQTVQDRVERSAVLQQAIKDADEKLLDISESHLSKMVKRGDKDMVRFHLTTRGKKRGYGNNVAVGFDESQGAAFIEALGGSVEAYRAALQRLGVAASEIP